VASGAFPRPGGLRGDRFDRLEAYVRLKSPSLLVTQYSLLLTVFLAGCGGTFMTSTPTYARYTSNVIFKEFKAQGLRVDAVQEMPKDSFGAEAPRYSEAKGFLCGANGAATATLFTFDSATDLAAMSDFVRKKYGARQRQLTHQNVLLVFWLPSKEDTFRYDSVLLALR
jgi:hypothetical protein